MQMVLAQLLLLLAWPVLPVEPAEDVAARAGYECERGCIVGADGWVYENTREDQAWFARVVNCEVASVIGTDDASAAMWALVQGFYLGHLNGRDRSLASYVTSYSACTSKDWSSAGTRYSPRITPIADANRATRWRDLPQRVRDFARTVLQGHIGNRWPGYVYVLTHGWEREANHRWIGPLYAETRGPGTYNAYWKDRRTVRWTNWTVRIVGPLGEEATP